MRLRVYYKGSFQGGTIWVALKGPLKGYDIVGYSMGY